VSPLCTGLEEIVRVVKDRGLQAGIATNGSRLERVEKVAHLLTDGDWLRLSLDAATEDTFVKSHRPGASVTLGKIRGDAQRSRASIPGYPWDTPLSSSGRGSSTTEQTSRRTWERSRGR
jgi:hypothetical protein